MEYQKALYRLNENLDQTNKMVDQLQALIDDCLQIVKQQECPPALVGSNLRCDVFPTDPDPHVKLTSVEEVGDGEQRLSTFVSHVIKPDKVRALVEVFLSFLNALEPQKKEREGQAYEIFRLAYAYPSNIETRVDPVLGQIVVTYNSKF